MAANQVQVLIADGKIKELINVLDELEINLAGEKELPPYSLQLLSYLIVNDLDNARFLWKRIPDATKKDAQLTAVWTIAKAMWVKDFPVTHQSFSAFKWDEVHAALMAILKKEFRNRTITLVSQAFASIATTNLAAYLGVSVAEVSAFAKAQGWAEADGWISPVPVVDKSIHLATAESLHSLSDIAVYLETDFSIPWSTREAVQAQVAKDSKAAGSKPAAAKKGGAK